MKKKILFLGFLIGIFAALMILPASAVELPAADAGCEYCRPTWEQVEELHCNGSNCACYYATCPTCGDETVLVYCSASHFYSSSETNYRHYCNYCDASISSYVGWHSWHFGSNDFSIEIVDAKCLARGYKLHTCAINIDKCNIGGSYRDTYTVATLEHTFEFVRSVEATCGSYSGDLYECSGCGFQKIENPVANPHTPIDSGTVTPATCTTAGYTTHTCSTCGESYTTDGIPATGHTYTSAITTPATCSATGVKTYTCSGCGHSYTESIPATGHTYTSTVTTPATCSVTGVKTYTCSGCNHSYTESIAKTDHSYQSTVTAPTCTATGYTTYTCTVCTHTYTGNTTAATGHKNTTKVNTAATCTTAGSQTTTCSVCGYSSTASIPATGHSYKGTTVVPDCTEGGYTKYVCSTCSDSYIGDQIPAAGHQYQHLVTEPLCELGGFTQHVCSVCEDSYVDSRTPPTGHTFESTVTAPTCTVRGYTTHVCTGCNKTYRDSHVEALGHTEEPYGLDFKCTVCGNIRVVTTGIRALNSIANGLKLSGAGFASGMVDLVDGLIDDNGKLTTLAQAAFSLVGFVMIGASCFALFYKFNRRM